MPAALDELDIRFGPAISPRGIRPIEQRATGLPVQALDGRSAAELETLRGLGEFGMMTVTAARLTVLWAVGVEGVVRICIELICEQRTFELAPRLRGIVPPDDWKTLGHPTLLAGGPGRIAGELYLERSGSGLIWILDNKSGRYSADPSRTREHLDNVAELFGAFGLTVYARFRG